VGSNSTSLSVLHCIPSLAGGGSERQLCQLAAELANLGVRTHIAFAGLGPNFDAAAASGATLHHLSSTSSHDPRLVSQVARVIRDMRIDVVQTWLPQMDVVGGLASRWRGAPFVLSERSSSRAYSPSLRTALRRMIGSTASAIVANSEAGLRYWSGWGRTSVRRVIRNSVAPDLIEFARVSQADERLRDEPAGAPLVLFVGRFHEDKNVLTAARAVVEVMRQRPDVRAEFWGEGPLDAALRGVVAAAGLGHRWQVLSYDSRARERMKAARVLVAASFYEGHPNVVVEAALCGCSLVVSDIEAHREILDEDSARLVDAGAPDAVAEGILSVLDESPAELARRTGRARDRAMQLTAGAAASAYLDLYSELKRRR
jgi:glycosyltransferase involved in cell wall biosynthesis